MTLGLYDFGDGGRDATKWQRQHRVRLRRREAKKRRAEIAAQKKQARAEDMAELKKRRARYRQACKNAKRLGLKKPRPPRINRAQIIDLTGQQFGRLTVIRQAPMSKNRGRNRCCYVKCSCPRRGVYLVAQTNLRQGLARSCGCLAIEALRARKGEKRGKPLSERMLIAAKDFRQKGDVRTARMLELAAPAMRRAEQRKARKATRARFGDAPGQATGSTASARKTGDHKLRSK